MCLKSARHLDQHFAVSDHLYRIVVAVEVNSNVKVSRTHSSGNLLFNFLHSYILISSSLIISPSPSLDAPGSATQPCNKTLCPSHPLPINSPIFPKLNLTPSILFIPPISPILPLLPILPLPLPSSPSFPSLTNPSNTFIASEIFPP